MQTTPTTTETTMTTTTMMMRKTLKAVTAMARGKRVWLVLAAIAALATFAGSADASPGDGAEPGGDEDADADAELEAELAEEPAWDPEPAVTRGGPAPAAPVNVSTPTPKGLTFAMELKVGLATKPVAVNAAGTNGGKIVVTSTGRWKAAAGPEKVYAVILERKDGNRWVPVGGAKPARVGASKVRHEWAINDRADYRVTMMARRKGATGPLLRVEGELRTIIFR